MLYFNYPNYFKYNFENQNGIVLYDSSGLNNHATWTNGSAAIFWGTKLNTKPYILTEGATIYTANSAPTDSTLWIYVCGDNALTITGYTKLQYFAPNLGILKGLSNTYLGINHSDWLLNEKTFTQIDAETPTDYFKITKTANNISRLKIRAKQ